MIRKEFIDILKPVFFRVLSGVLIIFLFFTSLWIVGEKNIPFFKNLISLFNMLFWIIIIWISYNLGINMFKKEKDDHSMEYLLSSPLTKTEILIKKIAPRLLILIFLLFLYYFIQKLNILIDTQKGYQIDFFSIMAFTIGMFFCSVFLSIYEWGNFKAIVWIIFLFPGYYLCLILDHFLQKNIVEGISRDYSFNLTNISLYILLIVLGIGFIFVFKYSDIRPQKFFKNKFTLITIIPLVAIILTRIFIN